MTAIAPPPAFTGQDPTAATDNAAAVAALRHDGVEATETASEREPETLRLRRRSGASSIAALLGFAAATVAAGAIGGYINKQRKNKLWYRMLRKPSFTPPDRVFGLVWPALYTMTAISGWRVWKSDAPPRDKNLALGLWGAQLVFNGLWSWAFFGKHRPRLALADLAGNYVSLGAYALAAAKVDKQAALLVTPYLGWVTFAGALNAGIVQKNRGPIAGLFARG